jgi:hypothetical protein
MKTKFHLLAIAGFAMIASCKNSTSDKSAETDDTSASTTVTTSTTDNAMVVEAPQNIRTSFESKYPQATNIRWQYHRPDIADIDWDWSGWTGLDDRDYAVSYNWDGNEYWAWYDQDGNWIGTVNRVADHASLPTAVNTTIKTNYSGNSIVSVDRENDKDRTVYEIDLDNGAKLLVDENGKILKQKDPSTDTKTKVNPKDSM